MRAKPAVAAVAAVTALALTGCGDSRPKPATTPQAASAGPATSAPASPAVTTPSVVPPSSSAPPKLGPVQACRKAAKVVAAATKITADFADNPDGSTTSVSDTYAAAQQMRDLQPSIPAGLADNLGRYADMLDSLGMALSAEVNATIKTGVAKEEAYAIIVGCGKYVEAHG